MSAMNRHQTIRTAPASLLIILCCLLIFCQVSFSVGKAVVVHRKNVTCIDQERDALLKFKRHIQSDYCGLMASWGNPNKPDCCTWMGVSCSYQSGHVIGLNLSGDQYHPELHCLDSPIFSPSLGELKHLKYLDLSSNYFYGMVIPSSIGSLVNLVYLNLSGSSFAGNIPHQLGNLIRLKSLDLSSSYGIHAKSLNWLSRLTLLKDINLGGNDLSKAKDWFRIIGSLPLLEVLKMDHCKLSTPSPSSPSLQSANLRFISLSRNHFSAFSRFHWLFVNSNNSSLGQSLEHLDMSRSYLQGHIPDAIGNLAFLTYLDLSRNSLSRTIPDAIGNMECLTYLDLSRNSLSAIIPDAITNLQSLLHIDLSYNLLSGPIPSTLGSSSALGGASSISYLDLSNNQLEGTIPGSLANLEYLGYLDLSRNDFSGEIPCKLDIKKLPYFANFSNNNLSGSIPKHLSYLGTDSFQGNPSFRTDKIQGRCDKINVGLYVSIGLGFYTGFWAICGTLIVKNSWRHAYFRFIDHTIDKIYVIVAINLARFRRNSEV